MTESRFPDSGDKGRDLEEQRATPSKRCVRASFLKGEYECILFHQGSVPVPMKAVNHSD